MGAFFAYSIYSGVFLLFLFLFYKLLVSGEKQIALNRILLLSCYALAFAAWPISQIDWKLKAVESHPVAAVELLTLPASEIAEQSQPRLPQILIWIYMVGAAMVLLTSLFSIAKIIFDIRKGKLFRCDGYNLIVMPNNETAPFSIGKFIVMSAADYEAVSTTIIAHEEAHIRCRHYLDLIIAQIACVVLWYNPAAWLMRDELKLLHEYQADSFVLESGVDPKVYQMLLIRKTVGNRFNTLANNLNHSKLKNRIAMMQKEKSGVRRMRVFALVVAPMVAFGVLNLPAVASDLKSLEDVSLTQDHVEVFGIGSAPKEEGALPEDLIPAEFPGGTDKLMEYLALNIRYPQGAMQENRSGRTIVGYTIGTDGTISNIRILKSSSPDLDEEAIRVVKKMPDWTPSMRNGKAVESEFALPVNFRLPSSPVSEEEAFNAEIKLSQKLDEVVVVGWGAVQKEIPEYHGVAVPADPTDAVGAEDLQWEPTIMVDDGSGDGAPVYVDGVKYEKSLDDLDPKKIETIQVYRQGDPDYPNGAIFIKLKK